MGGSIEPTLFEFGFPGSSLRTQLIAAVLDGRKTTTTGLLADYQAAAEPLPRPGQRYRVPDNDGRTAAIIEIVEARIARLGEVDLAHVVAEGEGDESVEQWRAGHTAFFESDEMRAAIDDPDFAVDDDTLVVLQRFRLVEPRPRR
ncbi:MAG: ASCH domain-containing protein [Jatrophihabitans sp.]|uniref:ASCH domain-containing protein n=1 Tax=Jatrophihabitans sp. TaxID=1932789 RepID=UPI003F7EC78D